MGNFEKLGILVIIVLVVVIIVVAAVGMDDPVPAKRTLAATNAGGDPDGRGGARVTEDRPEDRPVIRPVIRPEDRPEDRPVVKPLDEPPPTPREPRKYEVKRDDSLWTIAEKMYGAGKGHLYTKIAAANPTVDAGSLMPGTELVVPDLAPAARSPGPSPAPRAVAGGRTYRIQGGDMLWNIARKTLGKGSRWPEIVAKNPGLDPRYLPVGKDIILPAR